MHGSAFGNGFVDGGTEHSILLQLTVFDGFVDAGKTLIHHASGAEVHVADFGVAHLAVRQAHGFTGGLDQYVRILLQQAVPGRGIGVGNRIVGGFFTIAPAIEDDQCGRYRTCIHAEELRQVVTMPAL